MFAKSTILLMRVIFSSVLLLQTSYSHHYMLIVHSQAISGEGSPKEFEIDYELKKCTLCSNCAMGHGIQISCYVQFVDVKKIMKILL